MAYDWGAAFNQLMTGGNIDTRTPEAVQQQQRGQRMAGGLEQEYANAQNDPNYGIGTPAQQQYQEQELANATRNRTGAAGSGGSGFEADQVRKAMVDFRINQIGMRQQAMNQLRQGMVTANQAGWPQPMTYQQGALQTGAGKLMGAGANAVSNAMFGQGSEDAQNNRNAAAGAGAAAGGNGFRVNPPGFPGGQSGGPGNSNPWGVGGNG